MSDDRPERASEVFALGASAGGVDALQRVLRGLPADLPAALCVVLHIPSASRGLLADVMARETALTVVSAVDGEPLRPGRVYVAPPDRHLIVRDGHVALERGPRENGVRPAIDPLFRSVADAYGAHATAVVLSGALSDGAAGAAAVAAAGGTVLVQEPGDASVPSMPRATLAAVPGAIPLSATALAEEIVRRAGSIDAATPREPPDAEVSPIAQARQLPEGDPAPLTCPECHGPLWRQPEGELMHYRCRVGHAFAEDILVDAKGAAVEAALWMAVEALEERTDLLTKLADRIDASGSRRSATSMRERALSAAKRAELIRDVLAIDDQPREQRERDAV